MKSESKLRPHLVEKAAAGSLLLLLTITCTAVAVTVAVSACGAMLMAEESRSPTGGLGRAAAARHPATWYDTFAGTREWLNVHEGNRVIFYSPDELSVGQYSGILGHLDSCMGMYSAFAGGAYPLSSPEGFPGKGSVALVEDTCGAGCGAGGRAEVLKEYADRSISRVGGDVFDPRAWQLSYYEMGRGGLPGGLFPFYEALRILGEDDAIGSGFPHFMAHACMHMSGVSYEDQEAHFRMWENHDPRENPPPHIFDDAYRALNLSFTQIVVRDNPELTLDPFADPPPGGQRRGGNHVYSMILTNLYRQYGQAYVAAYFKELSRMTSNSVLEVQQNLLDASLYAYIETGEGFFAASELKSEWKMNPDWRPRGSLGGLDLRATCRVQTGDDRAYPELVAGSAPAAFRWACMSRGVRFGIDMQRACRDAYAADVGVFGYPLDLDDAYSWGCYTKSYARVNGPDLAVHSPLVSDAHPGPGKPLRVSVTIGNLGNVRTAATTLHYYRSTDMMITNSDLLLGSRSVEGLSGSEIRQTAFMEFTAPRTVGAYHYGACVDSVSGESDSSNNCSDGVLVNVTEGGSGSGRNPALDLVLDLDNVGPEGIWSDGTTMWVTSSADRLFAYTISTGVRDITKEFDTLTDAGNEQAFGLWSDGATMWVSDLGEHTIYAYHLATEQRDPRRDLDAGLNEGPSGIWSDGTTMWVSDIYEQKIRAYRLATGQREPARDLDTPGGGLGIWSDGTTMWVIASGELHAYNMATRERDSRRVVSLDAENDFARGFWSDGVTVWVSEHDSYPPKLFAYDLPQGGGSSGFFTDHPIVPGLTRVKAVHFMELRSRIDALRTGVGLAGYEWKGGVLVGGSTAIRLWHLQELRTALEAVYAAGGTPMPRWMDATPVAGMTPIRAMHVMELRAAVMALE